MQLHPHFTSKNIPEETTLTTMTYTNKLQIKDFMTSIQMNNYFESNHIMSGSTFSGPRGTSPKMHMYQSYGRPISMKPKSDNDNDNDTLREVQHLSNEGLALQARVLGS